MDPGVKNVAAVANLVERVRASAGSVVRLKHQHLFITKLGEHRGACEAADAAADDDGVESVGIGREFGGGGFVEPGPPSTRVGLETGDAVHR